MSWPFGCRREGTERVGLKPDPYRAGTESSAAHDSRMVWCRGVSAVPKGQESGHANPGVRYNRSQVGARGLYTENGWTWALLRGAAAKRSLILECSRILPPSP